jgi:hypothetical protein
VIAGKWYTATDDHESIGNCHRCYHVGHMGGICQCSRDTTTILNLGFVTQEGISAAFNPYFLSALLGTDDVFKTDAKDDQFPWSNFTSLRGCKGSYSRKFNRIVNATDDEDQRNGLRCYKRVLVDPICKWNNNTRYDGYHAFGIKKLIDRPEMQEALVGGQTVRRTTDGPSIFGVKQYKVP